MLIYKRHILPQEIIEKVNAVTRENVIDVAQRLISKSPIFFHLAWERETVGVSFLFLTPRDGYTFHVNERFTTWWLRWC